MTKIIWMSDPHFQKRGTVYGTDPRERLTAAMTHMNDNYADADFLILSGDLVGSDIEEDYSEFTRSVSTSKIPTYLMVGNNDERNGLRRHWSLPDTAMPDFIQYSIDTDDVLVICLDTHKTGSAEGQFCDARRLWLEKELEQSASKPVYIFMHHPPLSLGLPNQDKIKLVECDAFLDLISSYSNVKHLFAGHVHRTVCGTVRGIPFATIGALSFQAPAPHPDWSWETFTVPREAPQYGVIDIQNGNLTLQFIQFCEFEKCLH